jgi:hypothetical protein
LMPNHFHALVLMEWEEGGSRAAPTRTLGTIVNAFKTVSAKRLNQLRSTPGLPVWQRNYYEHIVRTEGELERIRDYIRENPAKWDEDSENPQANAPVSRGDKPKRWEESNFDPIFKYKCNRGLGVIVAGDDGFANYRGFGKTNSPLTFGHNGAAGQLGWGDPVTGISLGYCTNGYDRNDLRQGRRGVAISSLAAVCAA